MPDQLDLKTAIQFAIENNFAIRQAARAHPAAGGRRHRGQCAFDSQRRGQRRLPAQRQGRDFSQTVPHSDQWWTVSITATQALFAGGGIRSSIKSSKLAREAAILDLQSVINDALLGVRVNFYNVLLAREKITVQEQNLTLLQQQLKDTTDRYNAGTVSAFEKLRAEVAVANARVPLITARNDYRLAIEALRQALGFTTNKQEDLRKIPDFTGTLDYTPATFDLQAAFDAAHANRPDLQRLAKLTDSREQSGHGRALQLLSEPRRWSAAGSWRLEGRLTNTFNDSRDGIFPRAAVAVGHF